MAGPTRVRSILQNLSKQFNHWYAGRRYADLGEPFIHDDWDVLVILDACRPEFLYECELPEGTRSIRYSSASESWEFMQANFEGRSLHDTVYITANPYAYKLSSDIFYQTRNLLEESWNEELGTVPPSVVTEVVSEMVDQFPKKRIIAHYMQPHFPFVGEKGRSVDDSAIPTHSPGSDRPGGASPWTRLRSADHEIDRNDVLEAYKENHELVASELFDLLDVVRGKIVVTADHANLIGDRGWPIPLRMYGHVSGFPHPKVRRVPWLEIENGPRPEIEADEPIDTDAKHKIDDDLVENRLRSLGYA